MLPPLFLCILSTTLNATFAAFSKTGPRCHNSSSPVNYRGLLPFPDGFLAIVPELFAIESWNFAWLTLLSSSTLCLSSGQVRSLTYDVIVWHMTSKYPARSQNAATLQHCEWQAIFLKKIKLQEIGIPEYSHFECLGFLMRHLRSGWLRELAQ